MGPSTSVTKQGPTLTLHEILGGIMKVFVVSSRVPFPLEDKLGVPSTQTFE